MVGVPLEALLSHQPFARGYRRVRHARRNSREDQPPTTTSPRGISDVVEMHLNTFEIIPEASHREKHFTRRRLMYSQSVTPSRVFLLPRRPLLRAWWYRDLAELAPVLVCER